MTIHIQITKGYIEGTYSMQIGDIEGSVGLSNIPLEGVLEEVREVCTRLYEKRGED